MTSSGNTPGDSGRMPSSDTSDFSVTSVRFLLEMSSSPSVHHTLESVTLGDTNDINNFVLSENVIDSDLLLEETVSEIDFISGGLSTVDLDFEDVVLLLSKVGEVVLSVGNSSHDSCVLSDSVELNFNFLGILSLSLITRESFLLGLNPVLVESAESSLVEMVSPDSGKGSEASGGLDISDQSYDLEGRSLDDGDSFDFFLLVELSFGSVDFSEDVGHACFESSEGSEVRSLGSVISGE